MGLWLLKNEHILPCALPLVGNEPCCYLRRYYGLMALACSRKNAVIQHDKEKAGKSQESDSNSCSWSVVPLYSASCLGTTEARHSFWKPEPWRCALTLCFEILEKQSTQPLVTAYYFLLPVTRFEINPTEMFLSRHCLQSCWDVPADWSPARPAGQEILESSLPRRFLHRFKQVCLILCHTFTERINPHLAKGALMVFSCHYDGLKKTESVVRIVFTIPDWITHWKYRFLYCFPG